MGKAKKGKRTDKDDDFDSDIQVEDAVSEEPIKSKKSKDKKKKGDDIDELSEDLKGLKVEKSKASKKDKKLKKQVDVSDDDLPSYKGKGKANSESDTDIDMSNSKQKNRKNLSAKKGFAALSVESNDDLSDIEKSKSKTKMKKGNKDVDIDSNNEDEGKVLKSKNKRKSKKQVDLDDSDNETRKSKAMTKKGKKPVDSDASDEDESKVKNKNKSNAKKNKKKDSDNESDDDVPKSKGKTKDKKGRKASDSEDDFKILPSKITKNASSKVPKASFALLNMDDDVNEDLAVSPSVSDDESTKRESVERSKPSKQQKPELHESQKESKKTKKAKKKRNDSDEDIDKVLAELEMEYSGQKKPVKEELNDEKREVEDKTLNQKKLKETEKEKDKGDAIDIEDGGTVKTAAQKKKEKKEREKQKKLAQKKAESMKKPDVGDTLKDAGVGEKQSEQSVETKKDASDAEAEEEEGKKKKKKGVKEDPKEKGKGPGKKLIAAMQEALKKAKEEEERLKREEEERIRLEDEREKARLEKLQKEQERKEKKKLKEKQRKEKLKAEGKLLTNKQKQAQARAQAMLEALKAQGLEMPEAGEKKPRPGTRIRPSKLKQQISTEAKEEIKKSDEVKAEQVQVEIVDKQEKVEIKKEEEEEEAVKDVWDAESSEEEAEDKSDKVTKKSPSKELSKDSKVVEKESTPEDNEVSSESSDSESEGSDSGSDEESEEESEVEDKTTDAERKRRKVRERIQNRRIEAEKKRTLDNLRAAVVCVLGHVDTGKTKILDKLRRTNVQDGEAGGITQQIGATNVPIHAIQESTKHVKGFESKVFKIPGLLIIDTPGHESFSNLRNRGSSLCDIAILVVDIMHGLEPQTIESINLLKAKKCPFIVALNKIDRLYDWQTMSRRDVQDIIKSQAIGTQREFEKRYKEVIVQFAEQSLNAAIFYENPDPRSYVSLVPTSAITGEGMGNLLALIVDACQGPLAKRLMFSEELEATVLEVKALPGLGTTIDCILLNGILREGDTMIVAGTDGPIVTQIRSLLMPQPLKELRVKSAYVEHRVVKAAQGVKIAAKILEKAIAGLKLVVAQKPDEVEILKEEIDKELTHALSKLKLVDRGVFVQASTLGALEALGDFLKSSKIPYAGIRIGPVVKKDVMKASIMLEHDSQYATILAFDVKVERDAQELADSLGVKIFQADIIYHLFDRFIEYKDELRMRKREENKHIAVFPCKLKILSQFIFKTRDPIIMGVMIEDGIIKQGTPICVPSKDFIDLGIVTTIQINNKALETARKGQEVCIKIEPIPGETPKMFGRHFDEKDMLISKISRQSIDACKNYFREDLIKADWQLMVELKKLFQIL
ncbi:PREDICTED: eukaryotic translation initiation factor 5B [Ceratosolen solmsi marchali]|uniref:Eukaryotic translation initiation factor 5B n=1 Tax=Ceratosolen solmsi marchali TaxID=326594 RepID=A0AAJ6YJZ3_9HYME|nr:PREDICTED: eukaryotic translation initiation factor 5B [Ceratosolen solmsi marchali]